MPVQAGLAAAQTLTGIASTVAQIKDAKSKLNLQTNLAFLDAQQKADLERELQATTSRDNRMAILINAVSNIRAAQTTSILSSTITSEAMAKSKQDTNTAIAVIGGSIALLVAIVILKRN